MDIKIMYTVEARTDSPAIFLQFFVPECTLQMPTFAWTRKHSPAPSLSLGLRCEGIAV